MDHDVAVWLNWRGIDLLRNGFFYAFKANVWIGDGFRESFDVLIWESPEGDIETV